MSELKNKWAAKASTLLVGKKITAVRYLTEEETESLGWQCSSLVIILEDGSYIFPSSDDEGNAAGALFTSSETLPIIPVIR